MTEEKNRQQFQNLRTGCLGLELARKFMSGLKQRIPFKLSGVGVRGVAGMRFFSMIPKA